MRTITATEAARRMSDVLDAVEDGEQFVIARHGRVVARLEPATGGIGKAVKDVLRRAPRDTSWVNEVRELRAMTPVEDRRWNA